MDYLNHLYYHRYRITLLAKQDAELSDFIGSALNGLIGRSLAVADCRNSFQKSRPCHSCNCSCATLLKGPTPTDWPQYGKYPYSPPFVLEPPLPGNSAYKTGDELTFESLLVGQANGFFPFLCRALRDGGFLKKGKFKYYFALKHIETVSPKGKSKIIYRPTDTFPPLPGTQKFTVKNLKVPADNYENATLIFSTYARILKKGSPLKKNIPFESLSHTLHRHLWLLAAHHCGYHSMNEPFFDVPLARTIQIKPKTNRLRHEHINRISSNSSFKYFADGFLGAISYTGHLQYFLKLLLWGEQLHVGKEIPKGWGKYLLNLE